MEVFRGLLHDASTRDARPDLGAHRALGDRPEAWTVGPLVVTDERLSGLSGVPLSVRVGGGAGSVGALAGRLDGLDVVAVETVLRDLDDLPGNASRVVAAAAGLPEGVDVLVGIPAARGTVEAVEVVEAAGLLGRVDLSARDGAGALLSVLVEADLPFKVTGLGDDPLEPYGLVALLMAVEALVDGADPDEADALLAHADRHHATAGLRGWDAATTARVRRRLRGADCADVPATLDRLGAAGLLR